MVVTEPVCVDWEAESVTVAGTLVVVSVPETVPEVVTEAVPEAVFVGSV